MTHVLLWSKRQNALHVEPVHLMLASNRGAYRDDRSSDYLPIAMGSRDMMMDTATSLRATLMARATPIEMMTVAA